MSFDDVRSVLIIKLSSIGDVVHALPALAALRRRFPRGHIAWAVGPAAAEVVAGSPHLSETLVIGGRAPIAGSVSLPSLGSPRALARALRRRRFDLALDLQGLLRSALVGCLSGAPRRMGSRGSREGALVFYNLRVAADRRGQHAVEGYLEFARALGAPVEPVDFTIATDSGHEAAVRSLLGDAEELAALVPGARWLSKRWPVARFAAVAEALASRYGLRSVVVGGAADGPLAGAIAAAARAPVLDLTGRTTLKELAALLRRCRVVVSNDTGPMHLAAAVGTPTVAIFGPTDPQRLGPYGAGHATVSAGVPCAPCRRRRCDPLRCLEAVEPEEVMAAVGRVLRRRQSGGDRAIA